MEKAVIDRFEGKVAVLLVGDAGRVLNVARKALPRGAREGQWLQVDLEGDELRSATIAAAETARARQRIMETLERLRKGEHLAPSAPSAPVEAPPTDPVAPQPPPATVPPETEQGGDKPV